MTSAWALLAFPLPLLPLSPLEVGLLPKPVYTAVASASEPVASPVATDVEVDVGAEELIVDVFTLVGSWAPQRFLVRQAVWQAASLLGHARTH